MNSTTFTGDAARADHAHLPGWAREFFTAVDSRDFDTIASYLRADVRVSFANQPPVVGR
jgi:hypothetical protein